MRFIFKTRYEQDIQIFEHRGQIFWYGLLIFFLVSAPIWAGAYELTQLTFICIYSIIGFGLMLLVGFTGQISLGHAGFLAVGAYTEAILASHGVPLFISLPASMFIAGLVGIVVGLPALRLKGIYLAIATLAANVIIEEILARWESLTKGNAGMAVEPIKIFDRIISGGHEFYYLCLGLAVCICLLIINLLRSPTGRAFIAIRDSETSASCMGINLSKYKTLSFSLSAAITGLAGALYAHQVAYISPEQFSLLVSIELITIVIIGGVGFLHGAVLGAAFIILLPQLMAILKDFLPAAIAGSGLQTMAFGVILIAFIIFEPMGIYGVWIKIRTWFELFPFYRKGMFRRQRNYMKTERLQ